MQKHAEKGANLGQIPAILDINDSKIDYITLSFFQITIIKQPRLENCTNSTELTDPQCTGLIDLAAEQEGNQISMYD